MFRITFDTESKVSQLLFKYWIFKMNIKEIMSQFEIIQRDRVWIEAREWKDFDFSVFEIENWIYNDFTDEMYDLIENLLVEYESSPLYLGTPAYRIKGNKYLILDDFYEYYRSELKWKSLQSVHERVLEDKEIAKEEVIEMLYFTIKDRNYVEKNKDRKPWCYFDCDRYSSVGTEYSYFDCYLDNDYPFQYKFNDIQKEFGKYKIFKEKGEEKDNQIFFASGCDYNLYLEIDEDFKPVREFSCPCNKRVMYNHELIKREIGVKSLKGLIIDKVLKKDVKRKLYKKLLDENFLLTHDFIRGLLKRKYCDVSNSLVFDTLMSDDMIEQVIESFNFELIFKRIFAYGGDEKNLLGYPKIFSNITFKKYYNGQD